MVYLLKLDGETTGRNVDETEQKADWGIDIRHLFLFCN